MTNENDLYEKILFEPIYVPVNNADSGQVEFMTFDLGVAVLTLGFSSLLNLARFCGEQTEFIEISAHELFPNLIASQMAFGFDFKDEVGEIFDVETLSSFLGHIENGVEASVFKGASFAAPNVTPDFISRLSIFLGEFKTLPELAVVEDGEGHLIMVLSEKTAQAEISLFAKLHQFARLEQDRSEISILTCGAFGELGAKFKAHATIVPAKPPKAKEIQPPKLRY